MGCTPGLGTRLLLHAVVLVVVLVMAASARAYDASDTLSAIEQASATTGVSYSWLHRVVSCETGGTLSPGSIGDHGSSFGAAQLHRGGGELPRCQCCALWLMDPIHRKQDLTSPISWVIVGGESGPKHRPFDIDWARSLRDQCQAAGVAFHFKQVGGRTHAEGGCLLDGREYKEFPEPRRELARV